MSDRTDEPMDPLIEARIDRTLDKYRSIATPDMLRVMRRELRELMATHPVAVGLMEQLRPRDAPDASHERVRDGATDADEGEASGGKGGA